MRDDIMDRVGALTPPLPHHPQTGCCRSGAGTRPWTKQQRYRAHMSGAGSCGNYGDIPNPVTQSVLLEELFGEVLEVPLGKRDARGHGDLSVA